MGIRTHAHIRIIRRDRVSTGITANVIPIELKSQKFDLSGIENLVTAYFVRDPADNVGGQRSLEPKMDVTDWNNAIGQLLEENKGNFDTNISRPTLIHTFRKPLFELPYSTLMHGDEKFHVFLEIEEMSDAPDVTDNRYILWFGLGNDGPNGSFPVQPNKDFPRRGSATIFSIYYGVQKPTARFFTWMQMQETAQDILKQITRSKGRLRLP